MTSSKNKKKTYIPANSGWFVHHLIWVPENASDIHDEDSWKYFVKVSPVALWASTDEGEIEPVIPNEDPVNPMQNGGFMPSTKNYVLIGVFHHDSYRMGDVVPLPSDYNPLDILNTAYFKGGVPKDELSEGLLHLKKTAMELKEYDHEDKKSELFAKKMKLLEKKSAVDEELRTTTLLLELSESGKGLII
jgi:hypothetical protein